MKCLLFWSISMAKRKREIKWRKNALSARTSSSMIKWKELINILDFKAWCFFSLFPHLQNEEQKKCTKVQKMAVSWCWDCDSKHGRSRREGKKITGPIFLSHSNDYWLRIHFKWLFILLTLPLGLCCTDGMACFDNAISRRLHDCLKVTIARILNVKALNGYRGTKSKIFY